MIKWYESEECNSGVIIGGQVCLVRNLADYLFEEKISLEDQKKLLENVCYAVRESESNLQMKFDFYALKHSSVPKSQKWIGKLAIPPLMMADGHEMGLLISEDESVSILVNGKEHICIQVSCAGANIAKAVKIADRVDDALNQYLVYAFSDKYGYLTSSPYFTGTGMSASYLLHLPYLENGNYIHRFDKEVGQFGFTLRGHFDGQGTAPGNIYRIKNRKTLGISESEILSSLENLAKQISEQENLVSDAYMGNYPLNEADKIYRSYGLLKYSRRLDYEETLSFLSATLMAKRYGMKDFKNFKPFSMMVNVQAPVLTTEGEVLASDMEQGKLRAEYVHGQLPAIED